MILGNARPNGHYTPARIARCASGRRLREFTPEELDFVKQFKVDELRVDPGASFLREGARSEHLYTVLSGWAFRYKMLDDGRRQILNYALPADMVGLQGTLMREMEHSVEALTPLTLCVFPRSKLWDLYSQLSLARLRHHLARGARGAADRRASGQSRPPHRARAHRVICCCICSCAPRRRAWPRTAPSSFRSRSSISPIRSACRWCTPTRR